MVSQARAGTAPSAMSSWVAPTLVTLGAFLFYLINIDDGLLIHDEAYHILAARGLIATGEPRIAEGFYTRGLLYTRLVALSLSLFGDSLGAARLPAAVAMALTAGLLFAWLRQVAEARAAWLGAGLFAVSPFSLLSAQFVRFYALQSLLFLVGALCVYGIMTAGTEGRRRILLALVALLALAGAVNLQDTTLLGVLAIGIWVTAIFCLPLLADPAGRRWQILAMGAGVVVTLLLLLFLWSNATLGGLWEKYRWTPVFNEANENKFWYYHAQYILYYPTLWTLSGILAVLALAKFPRPGWFLLTIFAVGFILNSAAGPKSIRYIAYAQPFLFGLWGLGLAALWPLVARAVGEVGDRLTAGILLPSPWNRRIASILGIGAMLFLLLANPFWLRSLTLLADVTIPPELPDTRWELAHKDLQPWLDKAAIVVAVGDVEPLYAYGRYDLAFSPSKLSEIDPEERHDFGRDFRTGRRIIGTPESLERVIECYPSGLFMVPVSRWDRATHAGREVVDVLNKDATPLKLPPKSGLIAYVWEHPDTAPSAAAACGELPELGLPALTPR